MSWAWLLLLSTAGAGDRVGSDDSKAALLETWTAYKQHYLSEDGRVVDRGDHDRSTSEGQAYALVRAVWADDPETFERVRAWTVANLQEGEPTKLPAWHWGERADGSWGVQDPSPAADADQWLAWALLGAAGRWKKADYREQALGLLGRIWEEETALVGKEGVGQGAERRVVLPGPWARGGAPLRLNPSYWLPFAWRTFAVVDPGHPWGELLGPAYALFDTCRMGRPLPPDWCYLDDKGTVVAAPRGAEADDDFGFEAFRVGWTLAAEVRWHGERRAKGLLGGFTALAKRWEAQGRVPAVLTPGGEGRVSWEYPGMYGALLPAWGLTRPKAAAAVWERTLAPSRGEHGWGPRTDYYGQNWIWLGQALWSGVAVPMDAGG